MGFKMTSSVFAVSLAIAALAEATPANAAPDAPCPSGNIAIIRISKIAPGGSMAGFDKALADHAKWYADHGFGEDRITEAPVLMFDPVAKTLGRSADTVMTFHMHAHDVPMEKHDKAWDAYVAEYRANSVIQTETVACMPQ